MPYVLTDVTENCSRLRLSNTEANLLTLDVVSEMAAAIEDAARTSHAVMLCGGDRFFSNGLDLTWALARSADEMRTMFLSLGELVLTMLSLPVPIVGAMKGHAIGAAKTLICACDVRFGATGRARIGVPEILLGVPNPYFADRLLRHIVGDGVASDLIYSGRLISVEEAERYGILDRLAESEAVEAEAWKRTVEMAALPQPAFAECKSMRSDALCEDIRRNLPGRLDRLLEIWMRPETQHRLQAAAERLSK